VFLKSVGFIELLFIQLAVKNKAIINAVNLNISKVYHVAPIVIYFAVKIGLDLYFLI